MLKKVLNYLSYITLRLILGMFHFVPMRIGFGIGRILGEVAYRVFPERRRIALRNLEIAFGKEKSEEERKAILRKAFINAGYTVMEFIYMKKITDNWREHFEFEGAELLDECIKKKKSFFVFGGHLGAWMLIRVFPKRFSSGNVVITRQRNPYIHRWIESLVRKSGGRMLPTRGAGKLIEELILKGEIVGFYLDQEAKKSQGVMVDFFGLPASSHVVPGYLAWKHRIPMFPYWMIRVRPGYVKAIFKPPVEFSYTGNKEYDIRAVTQKIVKEVENAIRAYPEQWFWVHNRWKRTLGEDKKKKRKKPKKHREERIYMTSKEIAEFDLEKEVKLGNE